MAQVLVDSQGSTLRVRLNRPEKHNAFEPKMIKELTQIFKKIKAGSEVRAVLLSGEGESFCSGGDLTWMKSMAGFSKKQNLADAKQLFEMYDTIRTCPVPVLAKGHGNIFGGGVGLLGAADIAVVVEGAKLSLSEGKLGLVPAVISPFVMRKMHQGWARELMLSARIFNGAEAVNSGLVQFSGSEIAVDEFLTSRIQAIHACGPEAVRETKKLMDLLSPTAWTKAKTRCAAVIAERRVSKEGQEGLAAFFEKRQPKWKG